MSTTHNQAPAAWGLMAPAAVLMTVMLLGPLVAVLVLAFTDYQLGASAINLIGFANFVQMAADPVFWRSLSNTIVYAVLVVPGSVILGLGVAMLIDSRPSMQGFYRTVFFLPFMASLIAMSIVWEFMLHPSFGIVNHMITAIGFTPVNWLQDKTVALDALAVIGIWQNFGFNMVLFLAGLAAIPRDIYEAAELDGTPNALSRFQLITWPSLKLVTTFVLIISTIRSFQVFDTVHALTRGGPSKSTEVLLYTIYAEGFEFFRTGYAAAISIVFVAIVTLVGMLRYVRFGKRTVSP